MTTPFEQLKKTAEENEFAVRVAATVGADAAEYIASQIGAAMTKSGALFRSTFEPYKTRFEFYSQIGKELDRRIALRTISCGRSNEVFINRANARLFLTIAAPLKRFNCNISENPLTKSPELPKNSYESTLHKALHLAELATVYIHIKHLTEVPPLVHIVGPIVGLVLSVFDKHDDRPDQDAFAKISSFCDHLEKIDLHLKALAVGVYQFPTVWGTGTESETPRQANEALEEVECTLAAGLAKAQRM